MSDTIIRELKASDFGALIDTYYSFYDEIHENPSLGLVLQNVKPSMAEEHRWFSDTLEKIDKQDAFFSVAEVDKAVVGMCGVTRRFPHSDVDHRGELGIYVRKRYRGIGIGEALMKKTLALCKGNFEAIELSVFSNNDSAKALYKKMGFRAIGTRPKAIKRAGTYFDEEQMILFL